MQEKMMNLEKIINTSVDEIRQKMLSICENDYKKELGFKPATIFIAQMKDLLSSLGCQVVKGYFGSRDTNKECIVRDDKRHQNKGLSNKEIVISLGRIVISRNYYQHRSGGKSIYPLDEKLGVDRELLMPDVKEVVLFSSAFNTPEESSRMLSKCSFIDLHPTQIKRDITNTNVFLEATDTNVMDRLRQEEGLPGAEIMACSLDGVNVLLNQKGNKMGRPTERPVKGETTTSPSAYKNAMCESIAFYNTTDKVPERISTKYIARMPECRYVTFKQEFEKELKHAQVQTMPIKLVITDAHKSISGYLKDNPIFKDFHRIIDFYHASEHLSHLAEPLFGKASKQAKKWYIKYRNVLKEHDGGASKMIRSVEYNIKKQKLNKASHKEVQKHLRYFKKHKKYMDYAENLKNGWPIGSGVIEAACKSIV